MVPAVLRRRKIEKTKYIRPIRNRMLIAKEYFFHMIRKAKNANSDRRFSMNLSSHNTNC